MRQQDYLSRTTHQRQCLHLCVFLFVCVHNLKSSPSEAYMWMYVCGPATQKRKHKPKFASLCSKLVVISK